MAGHCAAVSAHSYSGPRSALIASLPRAGEHSSQPRGNHANRTSFNPQSRQSQQSSGNHRSRRRRARLAAVDADLSWQARTRLNRSCCLLAASYGATVIPQLFARWSQVAVQVVRVALAGKLSTFSYLLSQDHAGDRAAAQGCDAVRIPARPNRIEIFHAQSVAKLRPADQRAPCQTKVPASQPNSRNSCSAALSVCRAQAPLDCTSEISGKRHAARLLLVEQTPQPHQKLLRLHVAMALISCSLGEAWRRAAWDELCEQVSLPDDLFRLGRDQRNAVLVGNKPGTGLRRIKQTPPDRTISV